MGDRELTFEASGALMDASLVMRDRETDSWWSIITSDAIGGPLEGADLVELPVAEKTTWGDWVRRYPGSLVLSVDGIQHVTHNPYDDYFASERTYRDLEIDDARLEPKTPVFSFFLDGRPFAAAHAAFAGGKLFEIEELGERLVLLFREAEAPIFASTRAYLVGRELATEIPDAARLARAGDLEGMEPLNGIDTFWYTWVSIHEGSALLE